MRYLDGGGSGLGKGTRPAFMMKVKTSTSEQRERPSFGLSGNRFSDRGEQFDVSVSSTDSSSMKMMSRGLVAIEE